MFQLRTAKAGGDRNGRNDAKAAEDRQHTAPAQEIADQAREGRAQEIAAHRACQRPADTDLALLGADEIAGQSKRDRKHAAGADAGKDARNEQQRKRGRERAHEIGKAQDHQAEDHQPRLAEEVGGRPDQRLDHGEGKGEHGGEARGGRDADAEIIGDMRQYRIERAA